jgi:tRNA(Ile)-lysidine synthase
VNLNNRFVDYLTEKTSASLDSTYLLAVSGGVDSMSMIHLFYEAGLTFGVAHCNFSLRGEESNLDHQLVKMYCKQLKIPFHEMVFDTQKVSDEQHLSIQETARNLRYNWFHKLLQENCYDYVATAHHRDDNVETVLFNLIRGTGIKGLKGIPFQNNSIIRPLLFADKESLIQYAKLNQIPYRNDSSNAKNTYSRNKIRNEVIPLLKDVNIEAVKHIHQLSEHSYAISSIIDQHIEQLRSQIVEQQSSQIVIDCSSIVNNKLIAFYLYELLLPYNYNATQITAICNSLKSSKTGSQFFSKNHTATINRSKIIVQQTTALTATSITLEKDDYTEFRIGLNTFIATIEPMQNGQEYEPGILYLDAALLSFPLTIRRWENGDSFSPLGMKGKKKISDFLIDKKVSLPDKENTFVIISNNTLIAVLNHQIDDSMKATKSTEYILRISLQKKRGAN